MESLPVLLPIHSNTTAKQELQAQMQHRIAWSHHTRQTSLNTLKHKQGTSACSIAMGTH